MLKPDVVDGLRQDLAAAVNRGLPHHTMLHATRRSCVERLRFPDGRSVIFKYASAPFADEDIYLRHLAGEGVPVPDLHASEFRDGILGMVMVDLDQDLRRASVVEAAAAAVRLHSVGPAPGTVTWDSVLLACLPAAMTEQLALLRTEGRGVDTDDIVEALGRLGHVAEERSEGADLAPFNFCHGELHRSSIHIGPSGWTVLDVAKAYHGPGLLDLATWQGARFEPDPAALRDLIGRYVLAGGHPDALAERGGLAPELWALGWHRLMVAHWFLSHELDEEDTAGAFGVIRRQVQAATAILDRSDNT